MHLGEPNPAAVGLAGLTAALLCQIRQRRHAEDDAMIRVRRAYPDARAVENHVRHPWLELCPCFSRLFSLDLDQVGQCETRLDGYEHLDG